MVLGCLTWSVTGCQRALDPEAGWASWVSWIPWMRIGASWKHWCLRDPWWTHASGWSYQGNARTYPLKSVTSTGASHLLEDSTHLKVPSGHLIGGCGAWSGCLSSFSATQRWQRIDWKPSSRVQDFPWSGYEVLLAWRGRPRLMMSNAILKLGYRKIMAVG